MNILHINVAYICDKFYDVFYNHLLEQGINQMIYTPYRAKDYSEEDVLAVENRIPSIMKVLSPIKNFKDRLFYHSKIRKYFNDSDVKLNSFKGIDIIHAHSLYTDGGVAFKINEKYGIPYIVAVRTADTEKFMKYMKHLKSYMTRILINAKRIIFINPNIYNQLINSFEDQEIIQLINEKCEILPNGVDEFWLNNSFINNKQHLDKIKLVHVGRLINRKNQILTLKAAKVLIDKGYDIHVDIVGSGENEELLKKFCVKNRIDSLVTFHGFISDKNKLSQLLRQNDIFSLPSHTETFGVAYIEAMTQGLPVIYTKNQGIDGYLSLDVGSGVDSHDPNNLANEILRIKNNYKEISKNSFIESQKFSWEEIINNYLKIYGKVSMKG